MLLISCNQPLILLAVNKTWAFRLLSPARLMSERSLEKVLSVCTSGTECCTWEGNKTSFMTATLPWITSWHYDVCVWTSPIPVKGRGEQGTTWAGMKCWNYKSTDQLVDHQNKVMLSKHLDIGYWQKKEAICDVWHSEIDLLFYRMFGYFIDFTINWITRKKNPKDYSEFELLRK